MAFSPSVRISGQPEPAAVSMGRPAPGFLQRKRYERKIGARVA